MVSPYKSAARPRAPSLVAMPEPELSPQRSKPRRGSKHLGPCLPDGPADHVRVPQDAYQAPVSELGFQKIDHHRIRPIMFKNRHSPTPGIRLRDIDGEYCAGLEGAEDRVFEGVFHYREAKIRILWPGYPPFEKRIRTQDGRRGLLLMLVGTAVTLSMSGIAVRSPPLTLPHGTEPSHHRTSWCQQDVVSRLGRSEDTQMAVTVCG
ncbi:hypothetical protein B0H11DRAFT_2067640 [Mycena galericulata]|nr:hypothetical protein B0H11DRAFT_2067640 [Mycena galericulata]